MDTSAHTTISPDITALTTTAGIINLATLAFAPQEPLSAFPACPRRGRKSTRRQRHFLAGRWCAGQALAHVGRDGHDCLEPDAAGLPQWPSGWLGSISHTEGRAMAAVAATTDFAVLGIDVERIMQPERARRLHERIATDDEMALLSDMPIGRRVTLLFSAKEALYKALYPKVRRFMGFDAARLKQYHEQTLIFELTRSWNEAWPAGHEIHIHVRFEPRYVHTIAWRSP